MPLSHFFTHNRLATKIREINEKYREPRIKPNRGVTIALYTLRIYLIVLLGIIIVRFITLIP